MAVHRRIEVTNLTGSAGDVSMVRFLDRKIIDAANIQELGDELFSLVEKESRKNLLLNFASVEFLSSAALNKLIILDKKVKAHTRQNAAVQPEAGDLRGLRHHAAEPAVRHQEHGTRGLAGFNLSESFRLLPALTVAADKIGPHSACPSLLPLSDFSDEVI